MSNVNIGAETTCPLGDRPARKVAVFGGVYSNYLALEAVIADARAQGADAILCLGDVGAFGPYPDRAIEILRREEIWTLQGNYDDSVGRGLEDCQCGYTDPRDNHFAALSYEYTLGNTSEGGRAWLRQLPTEGWLTLGRARVRLAHGSPRQVNEFLWPSTTPEPFVRRLLQEVGADLLVVTHTGLPFARFLGDAPHRGLVNVGAIGRPANNGKTHVTYAMLHATADGTRAEFRDVSYDHHRLAAEMADEGLPKEFIETILTGWWTTCLEVLPAKERAASRY